MEFAIKGHRVAKGSLRQPMLRPSLGGYKLLCTLTLEPTSRLAVIAGGGLLLCNGIEICHLTLRPGEVPVTRDPGNSLQLTLECFLAPNQVHEINSIREGGDVHFAADVHLVLQASELERSHGREELRVSQSDWLVELRNIGYMDTLLVEIPVPTTATGSEYSAAVGELRAARDLLAAGGTGSVLASLKALADDLDFALGTASFQDVQKLATAKKDIATWTAEDRMLLVRHALGRLVRNAAHGGDARGIEVTDATAEAAFTMMCGLVRWCLTQAREGA